MSFFDRFRRKSQVVETETKNVSHAETEIPKGETETKTDKIDLLLKDVSSIALFLRLHDERLVKHDLKTIDYLVELLTQKKLISPEKKSEVEEVIREALRVGLPKEEVVSKLIGMGIPRSSAYRYAKLSQGETETPRPETETI